MEGGEKDKEIGRGKREGKDRRSKRFSIAYSVSSFQKRRRR